MNKKRFLDFLGIAVGLVGLVISAMAADASEKELIEETKKKVLEELNSKPNNIGA